MLLEHVFESSPGHCATTCVEEKFGYGSHATDRQPRPNISAGPLPDRQYSFTPSFPENSYGRLRLKGYVFDFQTDQFGDSESRHETYIQHGAITDSKPGMWGGHIQYGLHFFEREIRHQLRVGLLKWYCQDLPDLV